MGSWAPVIALRVIRPHFRLHEDEQEEIKRRMLSDARAAGSTEMLIKIRWQRWEAAPCQVGWHRFFFCQKFSRKNDEVIGLRPSHLGCRCPRFKGENIWAFLCATRQQINTWVSLKAVMFTFTSRYAQICLKTTTKMRLSSFSSPEVILRGEVSVLHAVCVCVCSCICAVLMFLRLPVSICGFVWFIFLPQCPLKTVYRCCNLNWCDIEFKPVRTAYCGTYTHPHTQIWCPWKLSKTGH